MMSKSKDNKGKNAEEDDLYEDDFEDDSKNKKKGAIKQVKPPKTSKPINTIHNDKREAAGVLRREKEV